MDLAGDITNAVAAQYGIMVMHAMDMYRVDVQLLKSLQSQNNWRMIAGNDLGTSSVMIIYPTRKARYR